jgi:hypothetical protein
VEMGNICVSMGLFVAEMMEMNLGVIVVLLNSKLLVSIASILPPPIATQLATRKPGIEGFAPTGVNVTLILMGEPIVVFLLNLLVFLAFVAVTDITGCFRLPLCSCPEGSNGLHCEFRFSLDDVNPYVLSSNDEGRLGVFGLIGVVVSALAVTCAIAALLRYHPKKESESKCEDGSAPSLDHTNISWKSDFAGAGVTTVELL